MEWPKKLASAKMEMQLSLQKYRQMVSTAIAMVCMPKLWSCSLLEDLFFFSDAIHVLMMLW
jgi:hypothetical protein